MDGFDFIDDLGPYKMVEIYRPGSPMAAASR